MKNFQSYMHAYVKSQIKKYWEERRQREEDSALFNYCTGRILAYCDVLKEMEQVQNIAEYCRNDVIATEAILDLNQKEEK